MKVLILLSVLLLSACANQSSFRAAPQYYRALGSEKQVVIDGGIIIKAELTETSHAVLFRFDDVTRLGFNLDKGGNGRFSCSKNTDTTGNNLLYCVPLDDKTLSATCYGSTENKRVSAINCSVMYDNEIAANFRF